jgi:putative transposase
MRKSYKYRIYPSKTSQQILNNQLELCRQLYNAALEQRISAYKSVNKRNIFYYDQQNELPDLKDAFPEYKEVFSQSLLGVLKTLDTAYQNFFRRVKAGQTPGFPRFKGKDRFSSIIFPQYPYGCQIKKGKLYISKVGLINIKLHRPIEGKPKTVTIKKAFSGKWYVIFSCDDVPIKPLPKTDVVCGIDLGIMSFAVTSANEVIENPKFFKKSEDLLAKRQQKLSRAKRGSNNRTKQRILVAKAYEKINSQRRDFHFKLANDLLKKYDTIFVEDLNIIKMMQSHFAKNIADCSWNNFITILQQKAEEAVVKEIIKVNPKNTSQICSGCGHFVSKNLSDRVHSCPNCNLVIDRDLNASLNVLRAGLALLADSHRAKETVKLNL